MNNKKIVIAIVLILLLLFTACGKAADSGINWDESYGIVVNRDGEKITIIISPERSEGTTQEDLDKEKEEYEYYSARLNSDGSVTRVVNQDYYDRLIAATGDMTKYYAQALASSDDYPNIVYAAYTDDFKASVIMTTNEVADKKEIAAMFALMDQAKNYLAIAGQDPKQNTRSYIVNANTGKYLYGITEDKVEEIDEIIKTYLSGEIKEE